MGSPCEGVVQGLNSGTAPDTVSLLGHVTPGLYRTNSFRLTGLPFETGLEQVVAALRMPLGADAPSSSPAPKLTTVELERAATRQLDARTLLFDEFFWLWPQPSPRDGRDKALEALARGSWLDAIDLWRAQCQQRAHDGVALHNIAVLFHMMAIDLESPAGADNARQARERDVWWKEAFRAWHSLHVHEAFWQLYANRLVGRSAASAQAEFVASTRAGLLSAVASVNGRLAAERASAVDEWDRQVALIGASGYPAPETQEARRIAAQPFVEAIRRAAAQATGRTRDDPRQGLAEATRLIDQGRGWLPFLAKVSLSMEMARLADEAAVAAMSCLAACGQSSARWSDLLAVAETALRMAQSPDTRARLSKQIITFRTNYSTQVHGERDAQVRILRERCTAILSSKSPAKERLGLLLKCARDDLRELVAAGTGDPDLEVQASGTLARAFRELALSMRTDGESVLLSLDSLSVAVSLYRDVGLRRQASAERRSIEEDLRQVQFDELSRIDSVDHFLLEYAAPDASNIYARNAFQLTDLSPFATERELSRSVQKLEMSERLGAANPPVVRFLGTAPPDVEATKDAVQRIRQVEHRFLDEFFWLWPLPQHAVEHGDGTSLIPLNLEQLPAAVDTWLAAGRLRLDHGICDHNFAVLHHMEALAAEARHRSAGLSAEDCARRDKNWVDAFDLWRKVLDAPARWEEVAQRIEVLGDPRLSRASMVRLRKGLPAAVLSTVVSLAVRAHGRDTAELTRLSDLVASSGFEPAAVKVASAPLIKKIREKLSGLATDATKQAEHDPEQANLAAQGLIRHAWAGLEILTRLLGEIDPLAASSHDEIALEALDCLRQFAQRTKDWPAVLKTLKEIAFLARGPSARETIQRDLKTVQGYAASDLASAQLDDLSKKLQGIVGGTATAEDRFAQLQALIASSPALLDEPDYLTERGNRFAHWLLELALRANNDDEKYALAQEVVRLALTLCRTPELLQRVRDAEKAVARNADAQAIGSWCEGVIGSRAANTDKLRQLQHGAQNQLELLKRRHTDDPTFVDGVCDTVAGAMRSVAIDLCNKDREPAWALDWLRSCAAVARGTALRTQLAQDVSACQALVARSATPPANSPPPSAEGSGARGFLTSCSNCNGMILAFSHRDRNGRVFCSPTCLEWFNGPRGFCPKCIEETTDESSGGLTQVNGVGEAFGTGSDRCPTCGSVVYQKIVTAFWVPVKRQSRYRVLYSSPSKFYSRRVK